MNNSKKIGHSKYKNTGILFELLVHRITAETIGGKDSSPALDIVRKFYNRKTELGKELQLYRTFFESGKKLTEVKAIDFIDLIVKHRKQLDEKKLAREKYELIKEIKAQYNLEEFLRSTVSDYKIYASIYKTFATENKNSEFDIRNIQDIARAKISLIEHLSSPSKKIPKESQILEEFRKHDEFIRLYASRAVVEKFNEKYSSLDSRQKNLLREYISSASNMMIVTEYVKKEIPSLKKNLIKNSKELDKVLQIKINEVVNQLDIISQKKIIKDGEVTAMIIAYELLKEIEQ